MTTLYANPYDQSAKGFYFESFEEYQEKSAALKNSYGQPVEEFEIDYIDGDDADLFKACGINQSNLEKWFDEVECLDDWEKVQLFYVMDMNIVRDLDEGLEKREDVQIFEGIMERAAEDLFDEIYAHEIPEHLRCYIDYKAFANDCRCGGDMVEFTFEGTTYTCTNANSI